MTDLLTQLQLLSMFFNSLIRKRDYKLTQEQMSAINGMLSVLATFIKVEGNGE